MDGNEFITDVQLLNELRYDVVSLQVCKGTFYVVDIILLNLL